MQPDQALVEAIRAASRAMVRELGFLQTTLAATNYSASAVHALLEIDGRGATTAAALVNVLFLEKSSVSRLIGKLVEAGEIEEVASADDGRSKQLLLTRKGKRTVAAIHAYGKKRVTMALAHLNPSQRDAVAQGLSAYAWALAACRDEPHDAPENTVEIVSGYRPGAVGRVAEMHAAFYSRQWGLGEFFERKVATGISEFIGRLDRPANKLWLAVKNERIVGSIAIDGEDLGNGEGHLRWFILDDGCRGSGAGRRLMSEAMAFCDEAGFPATQLWTFKGLDAARRLYESFGFTLTKEWEGAQWGATMTEQQFTRRLPSGTLDSKSPQR